MGLFSFHQHFSLLFPSQLLCGGWLYPYIPLKPGQALFFGQVCVMSFILVRWSLRGKFAATYIQYSDLQWNPFCSGLLDSLYSTQVRLFPMATGGLQEYFWHPPRPGLPLGFGTGKALPDTLRRGARSVDAGGCCWPALRGPQRGIHTACVVSSWARSSP